MSPFPDAALGGQIGTVETVAGTPTEEVGGDNIGG
jgi:hypothetical protein